MKTGYRTALSLTLAALCVALVAVTAVGVAHARYNQEVQTSTFPVTVAGNALQVEIGPWTEVKAGQYEATVTVTNTTEETVTYGLQALASLGLGKANVKLDDVYDGERTEILPGSVAEDTFGSGWSFLFRDSQGGGTPLGDFRQGNADEKVDDFRRFIGNHPDPYSNSIERGSAPCSRERKIEYVC